MQKHQNSPKITGDLNANKEHTHNISDDNGSDPSRGIGNLKTLSPILIKSEIQKHNSHPTKHKHESRRETLDDVLTIDAPGQEDDWADGAGGGVLDGADAGRLNDHVVDNSGNDHEIGEEDKGENGHG